MEEFFLCQYLSCIKYSKFHNGITKLQCINVVDDCGEWKLELKVVCACITVLVLVIAAIDSVSVVWVKNDSTEDSSFVLVTFGIETNGLVYQIDHSSMKLWWWKVPWRQTVFDYDVITLRPGPLFPLHYLRFPRCCRCCQTQVWSLNQEHFSAHFFINNQKWDLLESLCTTSLQKWDCSAVH